MKCLNCGKQLEEDNNTEFCNDDCENNYCEIEYDEYDDYEDA